jgi:hypothetical protein
MLTSTQVGGEVGFADLHLHTVFSDGADEPEDVVDAARRRGLDVLAVTDHDTIEGALLAARHAAGHEGGPEVIIGEEVSSRDGHILGLFLQRLVPRGLSAEETVDLIHAQQGIAIAAHPFWHQEQQRHRWPHGVGPELLAKVPFDAVECWNGGLTPSMYLANRRASRMARLLGMAGIGGSDAHIREAVGLCRTRFEGRSAAALRRALLDGRVSMASARYGPRILLRYLRWAIRMKQGRIRPRVRDSASLAG